MNSDFDAWRLKLGSLQTERDYLKTENDLVKRKLEEVQTIEIIILSSLSMLPGG